MITDFPYKKITKFFPIVSYIFLSEISQHNYQLKYKSYQILDTFVNNHSNKNTPNQNYTDHSFKRKKFFIEFRCGHMSTCDAEHSGRSTKVVTPKIIK